MPQPARDHIQLSPETPASARRLVATSEIDARGVRSELSGDYQSLLLRRPVAASRASSRDPPVMIGQVPGL